MVDTRIEVKGLEPVQRAINNMQRRIQQPQALFRRLGILMIRTVDKNFESEGRPTKWKKRSHITQATLAVGAQGRAKRTKRYQSYKAGGRASLLRRESLKAMSNKILSGQGDLKKSIDQKVHADGVEVGASGGLPYARIHQLGGVIRPKKAKALAVPCGARILRLQKVTIPARPYLLIPPQDVPVYTRATIDYIQEGRV